MTTHFVKRSVPKDGEVSLRIHQDASEVLGDVMAPDGLAGTHTAAEVAARHHEPIGVHQALASAIQLAGKYGGVVGVIDEQDLWKEEWGDLVYQD
jgi:hypothetical protein